MKVQIDINDSFVQDLLNDADFLAELLLVQNENNFISEFWIENRILDNDEITFCTQSLEMIKRHYCRINNSAPEYLEISYISNKPKGIRFTGPKHRLGYLVKIKTIENE